MKDCVQQQFRKERKSDNKVCQYCGKSFLKKLNRDRHNRNQHGDGTFDLTDANETVDESVIPLTFVPEFELANQRGTANVQSKADADIDSVPHQTNLSKILNVSFLRRDGNITVFLDETLGEMLDGDKFLRWLAKSLDYETFRLKKILECCRGEMRSRRHTFSDNQNQETYNFWFHENIFIQSTDRRSE